MIFTSLFKRRPRAGLGRNENANPQHLIDLAREEVAKLQHVRDLQEDDRWDRLNERLRLLELTLAEIVAQGSENAGYNIGRNGFRNH